MVRFDGIEDFFSRYFPYYRIECFHDKRILVYLVKDEYILIHRLLWPLKNHQNSFVELIHQCDRWNIGQKPICFLYENDSETCFLRMILCVFSNRKDLLSELTDKKNMVHKLQIYCMWILSTEDIKHCRYWRIHQSVFNNNWTSRSSFDLTFSTMKGTECLKIST